MDEIEDVIPGALYQADPSDIPGARKPSREQSYGLFIALVEEESGDVWMCDTYHLQENLFHATGEYPFTILGRTQRFIDGIHQSGARISKSSVSNIDYNCYYSASARLSADNAAKFEFLGKLENYRAIEARAAADYDENAVLENVKLWWEHAYPTGVALVERHAEPVARRMFDALAFDFNEAVTPPSCFFDFQKLEDAAKACSLPDVNVELAVLRYRYIRLKEMEAEWRELYRATDKIFRSGDEAMLRTWEAGVPIDDIIA